MPRRSGESRNPGRRWGTSAVADIHARDIERRGIMSEDKEVTRRQFLGAITWAIGGPTLFRARIEHQTGWIVQEQEHYIYVLSDNGRDFVAMSNICTHLGCRVRWIVDRE